MSEENTQENALQALLNTDEGKQQFQELAKGLGFVAKDEVDTKVAEVNKGLVNKRDELITKLKKQSDTVDLGRKTKDIIDKYGLSSYNDLEDVLDRLNNPNDSEEVRDLRKSFGNAEINLKKASSQIETLTADLTSSETFIKKILTENKLQNLCASEGCTQAQSESVASYLLGRQKFQMIEDNGSRKAVTEDGHTVSEFFTGWLSSDEAKELLPAKRNTGGGSSTLLGGTAQQDIAAELQKAAKSGNTLDAIRLQNQMINK